LLIVKQCVYLQTNFFTKLKPISTMKNLFKAFALTALLAGAFSSCDNDPCKDVVCGTQGVCQEGLCICNTGYEKDSANLCNTAIRAKYLGANQGPASYAVSESCAGGSAGTFSMTATAATSITEIVMSNFGNNPSNSSAVLEVTGSNTVSIKAGQQIDGANISGTGTMSGNTLTINYTATDATTGTQLFSCTMTCTKQ
jgi:hypothetical protein